MALRLHFTGEALKQMEALGVDQERVRTAIHAGTKLQRSEHANLARHRGLEVATVDDGDDYAVLAVRREPEWPRRAPDLPYARQFGAGASR